MIVTCCLLDEPYWFCDAVNHSVTQNAVISMIVFSLIVGAASIINRTKFHVQLGSSPVQLGVTTYNTRTIHVG